MLLAPVDDVSTGVVSTAPADDAALVMVVDFLSTGNDFARTSLVVEDDATDFSIPNSD